MLLSFNKELPGADTTFRSPDLWKYKDDEWDIRISIGDAPLDEAFYYTVTDPHASRLTIRELLDDYALNPARRGELDIRDYPELPFLQEELIQYRAGKQNHALDVSFYVNKATPSRPVDLSHRAAEYLSVCNYHDGSNDYRLLDLVIVAASTEASEQDLAQARSNYGSLFVFMLLAYVHQFGDDAFQELLDQDPFCEYHGGAALPEHQAFTADLRKLTEQGTIECAYDTMQLRFTEKGITMITAVVDEIERLSARYNLFDSVSIAPPALGIPGGFDARVQMMEFDGVEPARAVFLNIVGRSQDELFTSEAWLTHYNTFDFYDEVRKALAFRTHFSGDTVHALNALTQGPPPSAQPPPPPPPPTI